MREFDILKEIFAIGILCHGWILCITIFNFWCGEEYIIGVKINSFKFIWILMRLDDCEHIVQVIFDMIYACQFDGNFQIISVI